MWQDPASLADRVLQAIDNREGITSPAACRFLGQTGEAPEGWIAAADPVYLEPRLDHLCLHSLSGAMRDGELSQLVEHLQDSLGDAAEFLSVGACGYVKVAEMPVSRYDPDALHGYVPDRFLAEGEGVEVTRRLQSEIEMALHDHPVNLRRQADRLQPVNALWLWGGGALTAPSQTGLPALFANDPLLRGFWSASGASASGWSESLPAVFEQVGVAVVPEDDGLGVEDRLDAIRTAFAKGRARAVRLVTRDGFCLTLSRRDRWKLWRREIDLNGGRT
ncbi:MAG: hypothetical protein QNJ05_15925 [Woeseiaceae bacterium]|nr:hypothetical protein [Woeseiaceae bacterium]